MAHTRQFSDDIQQRFPFKPPIIKYIFDNINYKHLHKLYQCCKLFPNKFPLIIIHQIHDITHFGKSVFYNNQPISLDNGSKIWVSDKIRLYIHKIQKISDIWICTIKSLRLDRHNLSLNEFQILTQSGNIEELRIKKIFEENGTCLSVEEIVLYVPKAGRIGLSKPRITSETFMKLALLKRKCKISNFFLYKVNVEINADEFLKFIEAHASSNGFSYFCMYFTPNLSSDYAKNLCSIMNDKINYNSNFKNFDNKPNFVGMIIDP